nr:substrate-binding domain-containing protein [Butyrivibrio sp.]
SDITEYDKYYCLIADNYKSDFWQSVYQGALETAKEENIYVDLLGENLPGEYTTEELMQIAISAKPDGILVSADESDTMTELINEAVAAGIPVVTLYGDNTRSNRLSFVGVGGYSIGKMYGKQVISVIRERRREDFIEAENFEERSHVKVVVIANSDTKDTGQNIIIPAMQDAIMEENATDAEFSISIMTVDNSNSFSVEESIRDIFLNEEVPDVIVCLNELSTVCTYQAVVDFNKVGEVNILGYYDSADILTAIDRGGVYATISIDARQLGEYSIKALYDYYNYGNTSEYYLADVTLINKDNVSQFLTEEDEDE